MAILSVPRKESRFSTRAASLARLVAFVGLATTGIVAACVDGRLPVGPEDHDQHIFQLSPSYSAVGVAANAAEINRIRITVRIAGSDSILTVFEQDVDPTLNSWALAISVDLPPDASTTLEFTIELINVQPGGVTTIEWSGRTTAGATPGQNNTAQQINVHRGPIANLEVQAVTIAEPDSVRFIEGDTLTLSGSIQATTQGAQLYWGSLDTTATVNAQGMVTMVLPGPARIVAVAGPKSDTLELDIIQAIVGVKLLSDTTWIRSLGDTATVGMVVVDPRGDSVPGAYLWWQLSESTIVEDLGDGRFVALENGEVEITVYGARYEPVAAQPSRAAAVVEDTTVSAVGIITVAQAADQLIISPHTVLFVSFGDTTRFAVEALDLLGTPVPHAVVTLSSSDASVFTIDSTGLAVGVGNGEAKLVATSGEATDTADVVVAQLVGSLSLVPQIDTIHIQGDTVRIVAIIRDANDSAFVRVPPTWSASDPTVVQVDSAGLVTALAQGSSDITAQVDSTIASATVIVRYRAGTVGISPLSDTLKFIGDSARFNAAVFDAAGDTIPAQHLSWSIADGTIATVDSTGLVVAVAVGETTVTASSDSLDASAVVVVRQVVSSIVLSPDSATIDGGDVIFVDAILADSGQTVIPDQGVTWTSSDTALALVDPIGPRRARVLALEVGQITLTATLDGVSGTANLVLLEGLPTAIDVVPALTALSSGQTASLAVAFLDSRGRATSRAPDLPVVWTTSDATVATVDPTGRVTAGVVGSTYIHARVGDMVDSAQVSVVSGILALAKIRPAIDTARALGDTLVYTAVGLDSVGSALIAGTFQWSVVDTAVAQIVHTFDTTMVIDTIGLGVATPGDSMIAFVSTALVVARTVGFTGIAVTDTVLGASASDTVMIVVDQTLAASVVIAPAFDTVSVGGTRSFSGTAFDSIGASISVPLFWSAPVPAVAAVDSAGVATGVSAGIATVAVLADAAADTATLAVLEPGVLFSTAFANSQIRADVGVDSTVVVPVKLDMSRVGATGDLGAVQLDLVYDEATLQFDSATVDAQGIGVFNDVSGTISFSLVDTNPQGTVDVTLLTVYFTVKTVALGTTSTFALSYTDVPARTDLSRYSATPLVVNGRLRVTH